MIKTDLILYNSKIYTLNNSFSIAEAIAIHNQKIVAVGSNDEIFSKYSYNKKSDLEGCALYPGFIDAHCHFYYYGLFQQQAQLNNANSFDEVLRRVEEYTGEKNTGWILGRGWNQQLWANKDFPDNTRLDALFPGTPVYLVRIDGHAALANSAALEKAGISPGMNIDGGEALEIDGRLTGILVDNAMKLVQEVIPPPSRNEMEKALFIAQDHCFQRGITSVGDAGLDAHHIQLIEDLQQAGSLKMKIYAMLNPVSKNREAFPSPVKKDKLHIRAYKYFADGAMGSRGAALKEPYSDAPGQTGFLMLDKEYFDNELQYCRKNNFQAVTHAIGDAANCFVLEAYGRNVNKLDEHRWRIEHCQVVHPDDIHGFSEHGIIPSVQPVHAISDMYWIKNRLGERTRYAYAWKALLKAGGILAYGSDFPIEEVDVIPGFYAAVARKDINHFPEKGFQPENALTREEALKSMTIWAAYAQFEEKEKGSIEPGKVADLVVLDRDIMTCPEKDILKTRVLKVFSNGEEVQ